MIISLGSAHISWLIILCPILKVAYTEEKGVDGRKAANFSCAVYSYTFKGPSMNCSWNAGRMAPHNTQYFLYLKYYEKEEIECPHYIHDELGRRIRCYFPNVTVDKRQVTFRVNGLSKESPIYNHTINLLLYEHEKIGPPLNITVTCREASSYCTIQWKAPPRSRNVSDNCLNYQIKDEIRNTIKEISDGLTYQNYTKGVKHKLRIRTNNNSHCAIANRFGEWSEIIEFGTDPKSFNPVYLLLAVLVTILGILLLFFICKRWHIWIKLTSPIPQPKDINLQCEKNVDKAWMNPIPAKEEENEKITVVEEITTS